MTYSTLNEENKLASHLYFKKKIVCTNIIIVLYKYYKTIVLVL
jgi:hypothetical protein